MSRKPTDVVSDVRGPRSCTAIDSCKQSWIHNGGKRMSDYVPVGVETDMPWLRLHEEERYQKTAEAVFGRLADFYGNSVTPPLALSLGYFGVDSPIDKLHFINNYQHWK